jgi:shikimate kinase
MMKLAVVLLLLTAAEAFSPSFKGVFVTHKLHAGGFEWEDPQQVFDQGVENPFKNPNLMDGSDGMKVDPARLLSPRLSGSNLYFIGMMGSGKTAVGDVVARRESIGQAKGC